MRSATLAVAAAAVMLLATAAKVADDIYLGAEIGGSFIVDADASASGGGLTATSSSTRVSWAA